MRHRPLFSKVVVRLDKIERKKEEVSEGGLILAIKSNEDLELEQEGMCYGTIVAMGPYVGYRRGVPLEVISSQVKLGNKVLLYKHAGNLLESDDEYTYRAVEDLDLVTVIEEGSYEL